MTSPLMLQAKVSDVLQTVAETSSNVQNCESALDQMELNINGVLAIVLNVKEQVEDVKKLLVEQKLKNENDAQEVKVPKNENKRDRENPANENPASVSPQRENDSGSDRSYIDLDDIDPTHPTKKPKGGKATGGKGEGEGKGKDDGEVTGGKKGEGQGEDGGNCKGRDEDECKVTVDDAASIMNLDLYIQQDTQPEYGMGLYPEFGYGTQQDTQL